MPFKYVVHPGYVVSRNDGDKHYITFIQLCRLYEVNPNECINAESQKQTVGRDLASLTHLHPRWDGNYER